MPISCFYGTPSPPPAPFSPSTRYFSGHQPQLSDFNTEFRRLSDTCRGPKSVDPGKVQHSESFFRLFYSAGRPHPHPSHALPLPFCRLAVCPLRSRRSVKPTTPTPYHPHAHTPPNAPSPPMATGARAVTLTPDTLESGRRRHRFHRLTQGLIGQVGITLRRLRLGMPQHLADGIETDPLAGHQTGRRMP